MWAMMEKLRMLFINKYSKTGLTRRAHNTKKRSERGEALASALWKYSLPGHFTGFQSGKPDLCHEECNFA